MSTRDIARILIIVLPTLIILVVVYIILFVPISGTMICTDHFTIGELNQVSEYTVEFKNRRVLNVHFEQTITSNNKDAIIEYQKKILESNQDKMDSSKKESLSFDGTELKYENNIEYDKSSERVSIGKLHKIYKQAGTTCKYK